MARLEMHIHNLGGGGKGKRFSTAKSAPMNDEKSVLIPPPKFLEL